MEIDPNPGEYWVPAGAKVPDWFARKMQEGRPRPNSPHFRYAVSFWAAPLAFNAVIALHYDGTAEITAAHEGQIIADDGCRHHFVNDLGGQRRCYACGVRAAAAAPPGEDDELPTDEPY